MTISPEKIGALIEKLTRETEKGMKWNNVAIHLMEHAYEATINNVTVTISSNTYYSQNDKEDGKTYYYMQVEDAFEHHEVDTFQVPHVKPLFDKIRVQSCRVHTLVDKILAD